MTLSAMFRSLGFLLAALAPAALAGGCAGVSTGTVGGGGSTTSTEGGSPDCEGVPAGTHVCNANGAPAECNQDGVLVQQSPPCANNNSFCQDGFCTCNQGDISCIDGDAFQCQISVTPGQNVYTRLDDCESFETCVPGVAGDAAAGCQAPVTCSVPGDFACAPDSDTVLHCQTNEVGLYQWVPTFGCKANGFGHGCVDQGQGAAKPQDMCQNECNAFDFPIQGHLCGEAPGLFCAVLVCSDDHQALVPDHTDCRPSGASCETNEECESCFCESGQCAGLDTPQHCKYAQQLGCGLGHDQ